LPFEKLKLGSGDYDIDGRGDLLLLIDRGNQGSRLDVFLPDDGAGRFDTWYDDPNLEWSTARPY
jgi:hypothetical protein